MRGYASYAAVGYITVLIVCLCFADRAAGEPVVQGKRGRVRVGSSNSGVPPVTVLVQVSDLHLSQNGAAQFRKYGDRAADLVLLAHHLLRPLQPAVVLLTGDLVDSKDSHGRSVQYESEWKMYDRTITDMQSSSGLGRGAFVDVRGNHDVFNLPFRGGPTDWYPQYSASGRQDPHTRLYAAALWPPPAPSSSARRAAAAAQPPPGAAQQQQHHQMPAGGPFELHWLEGHASSGGGGGSGDDGAWGAGSGGSSGGGGGGSGNGDCPTAVLLGVDTTQEPGFRAPTNFVGMASPELLQRTAALLDNITGEYTRGCDAPVISYGHHPLSTVAYPRGGLSSSGLELDELLAGAGVSAYLTGHLHSAFGHTLHRMHGGRSAPPLPSGSGGGRGHMAELEAAAWKDDRRLRLLTVDNGTLSFADLAFHTRSRFPAEFKGSEAEYRLHGSGISAGAAGLRVGWDNSPLVLMTQPPDARYSRLGQAGAAGRRVYRKVRALVVPLQPDDVPADKCSVQAEWRCRSGGHAGTVQMQRLKSVAAVGRQELFEGELPHKPCGGASRDNPIIYMQVVSDCGEAGGGRSSSGLRPVGMLLQHDGGLLMADPAEPAPIPQTPLEWFVLANDWPKFAKVIFWALWLVHLVGMLLLPRAVGWHVRSSTRQAANSLVMVPSTGSLADLAATMGGGPPSVEPSPASRAPCSLASSRGAGPLSPAAPGNAAAAASAALARACLQLLLAGPRLAAYCGGCMLWWPAVALVDLSSYRGAWWCMVGYSVYLMTGPWMLARLLLGAPPALLFAFGMLVERGPGLGWEYHPSPDTYMVSNLHMALAVLPLTLATAGVLSWWRAAPRLVQQQQQQDDVVGLGLNPGGLSAVGHGPTSAAVQLGLMGGSRRWELPAALRLPPLLAGSFAGVLALHWALVRHLAGLYGPLVVLASPGFGWTGALCLGLLYWTGRGMQPHAAAFKHR